MTRLHHKSILVLFSLLWGLGCQRGQKVDSVLRPAPLPLADLPPPERAWTPITNGAKLDSKGNLWVATSNAGVAQYDIKADRWRSYSVADGLASDHVALLETDSAGRVWAIAPGWVSLYNAAKDRFSSAAIGAAYFTTWMHHQPERIHWYVPHFAVAQTDGLWIGGDEALWFVGLRQTADGPVPYPSRRLREKDLTAGTFTPDGRLWVLRCPSQYSDKESGDGSPDGSELLRIEGTQIAERHATTESCAVKTYEGVIFFPGGSRERERRFLLADRSGILWIETKKGVATFDPATSKWINRAGHIGLGKAEAAARTPSGALWFLTGRKVLRYEPNATGGDGNLWSKQLPDSKLWSKNSAFVTVDSEEGAWIYPGDRPYYTRLGQRVRELSQVDGDLKAFVRDSAGSLWAVASSGVLQVGGPRQFKTTHTQNPLLGANLTHVVTPGYDGALDLEWSFEPYYRMWQGFLTLDHNDSTFLPSGAPAEQDTTARDRFHERSHRSFLRGEGYVSFGGMRKYHPSVDALLAGPCPRKVKTSSEDQSPAGAAKETWLHLHSAHDVLADITESMGRLRKPGPPESATATQLYRLGPPTVSADKMTCVVAATDYGKPARQAVVCCPASDSEDCHEVKLDQPLGDTLRTAAPTADGFWILRQNGTVARILLAAQRVLPVKAGRLRVDDYFDMLHEDDTGRLWALGAKAFYLPPDGSTWIPLQMPMANTSVPGELHGTQMAYIPGGRRGLSYIDAFESPAGGTFIVAEIPPGRDVMGSPVSSPGYFLIQVTVEGKVRLLDPVAATKAMLEVDGSRPARWAELLAVDRAGMLWMGTDLGLTRFEWLPDGSLSRPALLPYLDRHHPASAPDLSNEDSTALFIGRTDAVVRVDGEKRPELIRPASGWPATLLRPVADGSLWIGYGPGGLALRRPDGKLQRIVLPDKDGSAPQVVGLSQAPDVDRPLAWMATPSGVFLVNETGGVATVPLSGMPIDGIAAAPNGRAWVLSNARPEVARVSGTRSTTRLYPVSFSGMDGPPISLDDVLVRDVIADKSGRRAWAATSGGLYAIEGGNARRHTGNDTLPPGALRHVTQAADGTLWLAYDGIQVEESESFYQDKLWNSESRGRTSTFESLDEDPWHPPSPEVGDGKPADSIKLPASLVGYRPEIGSVRILDPSSGVPRALRIDGLSVRPDGVLVVVAGGQLARARVAFPRRPILRQLLSLLAALLAGALGAALFIRRRNKKQLQRLYAPLIETAVAFFLAAGQRVNRLNYRRLTLHGDSQRASIIVHCCAEEWLRVEAVQEMFATLPKSTRGDRSIHYLLHQHHLDGAASRQLDRYRLIDDTVIIPLSLPYLQTRLAGGEQRCRASFSEVNQQYVGERDLFDVRNAVEGPRFFFGRRAILDSLVFRIEQGEHTALLGPRKSGKTSVLNLLEQRLADTPVIRIDLQIYRRGDRDWPAQFFTDIVLRFDAWAHARFRSKWAPPVDLALFSVQSFANALRARMALLERLEGLRRPLVILLDEMERIFPLRGQREDAGAIERFVAVTGGLRALGQTGADRMISLIVADVRPTFNRTNMLLADTNPFYRFFGELFLPALEESECDEMLVETSHAMGLAISPPVRQAVFSDAGGHAALSRQLASAACRHRAGSQLVELQHYEAGLLEDIENSGELDTYFEENIWHAATRWERNVLTQAAAELPVGSEILEAAAGGEERSIEEAKRHLISMSLLDDLGGRYWVRGALFRRWLRGMLATSERVHEEPADVATMIASQSQPNRSD